MKSFENNEKSKLFLLLTLEEIEYEVTAEDVITANKIVINFTFDVFDSAIVCLWRPCLSQQTVRLESVNADVRCGRLIDEHIRVIQLVREQWSCDRDIMRISIVNTHVVIELLGVSDFVADSNGFAVDADFAEAETSGSGGYDHLNEL